MTRISMRGAACSACLAILAGTLAGTVGWATAAPAAGRSDEQPPKEPAQSQPRQERQKKGTIQKPPPPYYLGMKLVEQGRFPEARQAFEQARRLTPIHPDVLNMLAYSQRKTGALDLAIDNYKNALRQRPDFPQAREYLGEAYVQAALRELIALERAGPAAEREHAMLLRAMHDAIAALPQPPDASGDGTSGW